MRVNLRRLCVVKTSYVLSIKPGGGSAGFAGSKTAWDITRTGLTLISKPWPLARPVAVLGSSAEDFALAVALDRMFGAVIWVPTEWASDPALRWPLYICYYELLNATRRNSGQPIVTSISLSGGQLHEAVQANWPLPAQALDDQGNPVTLAGAGPPQIVPAEQLNLPPPRHLACSGDYDFTFTSPVGPMATFPASSVGLGAGMGGAVLRLSRLAFEPCLAHQPGDPFAAMTASLTAQHRVHPRGTHPNGPWAFLPAFFEAIEDRIARRPRAAKRSG